MSRGLSSISPNILLNGFPRRGEGGRAILILLRSFFKVQVCRIISSVMAWIEWSRGIQCHEFIVIRPWPFCIIYFEFSAHRTDEAKKVAANAVVIFIITVALSRNVGIIFSTIFHSLCVECKYTLKYIVALLLLLFA